MKTRQVTKEVFQVKAESGKIYRIAAVMTQTYHEFLNPADNGWSDGLVGYVVESGGKANKKSDTEYEIVATGEMAVRIA